jgi:hypothetical protein
VWSSEFTTKAATLLGDSVDLAAGLNVKFWDLTGDWLVRASPIEQLSMISKSHREKNLALAAKKIVRSWLRTQERWNPELVNILGAALATAGLQLAAVMMARTRIIQRFTRVKFTLFCCTSAELFFSCCGSVAAPRHRPGHHDQVRDAQRAPPRAAAWEARSTTCAAPRAMAGRNDEVPSTHNERRRGQRPGHHGK